MSDTTNPADPPETVPPGTEPEEPSEPDSSSELQADRPETVPPGGSS